MTSKQDKAQLFHALHVNEPVLVLANAWDVASARIVESAGAAAVATTSAGVAWSLGYPDAAAVGRTIGRVLAAGAVGVNLEDAHHGGDAPLRTVADQTERIAAARAAADDAGIALYINARIDTYLRSVGDPAGRLQETLDRAGAYLEAGASGIFVPGTTEQATVAKLVEGIAAPVNLLVGPGAPPVPELGKLGVARVSAGSSIAAAAYALARAAAVEMATSGGYETITGELEYGSINALFG